MVHNSPAPLSPYNEEEEESRHLEPTVAAAALAAVAKLCQVYMRCHFMSLAALCLGRLILPILLGFHFIWEALECGKTAQILEKGIG